MNANSKPAIFRQLLKKGTVVMSGAFNAATALLIEKIGFEAVYISGAGLSNGMAGVPDIGLLTMTEMVQQSGYIANAVNIPAIADADTGFGDLPNIARTVRAFESVGVAGIHIEDQEFPKRCGHLPGKKVIPAQDMEEKIRIACDARENPDFLIIVRTDSRAVNSLEDAIERANRYIKAGADVIFPEALESETEFEIFAKEVKGIPLMANMTEFGKTPYISVREFEDIGYSIVIFPLTAFRVAMKSMEEALTELKKSGTQKGFIDRMQTREELYKLLRYEPGKTWTKI
ncbi:MAG: methylisocitrate lyase [Nitrospinae bacterium]|nr:methylisocitrate lyase [Nitrospinota bacterium]